MVLNPAIIFKEKQNSANWFQDEEKMEDYVYTYQDNAYTNSIITMEWLEKIFESETAKQAQGKWRLLIFDGFDSHRDSEMVEFCWNYRIIPFRIPSHTLHRLQPLNVGVFSALNSAYKNIARPKRTKITKKDFPNLLA